jgi:hypothetical protein
VVVDRKDAKRRKSCDSYDCGVGLRFDFVVHPLEIKQQFNRKR